MNKKHCGQPTKVDAARQHLFAVIASMMLIIGITACPVSVDGPNIKNGPITTANSSIQRIAASETSLGTIFPDPLTAAGPWDTQAKAQPIDMEGIASAGLLLKDPSEKYISNSHTSTNMIQYIQNNNRLYGVGAGIPGGSVIFNLGFTQNTNKSKAEIQNLYFAHFDATLIKETVYIKDPNPAALISFAKPEYLKDIQSPNADPHKIYAKYPVFFPVKFDIGMKVDITLMSNKSAFFSFENYQSIFNAGIASLEGLGINANVGSGSSKEIQHISDVSSATCKIFGGSFVPNGEKFVDISEEISKALATIDDAPYASIPSMQNGIWSWEFAAAAGNYKLAKELFKIFVQQAGAKAIELDSTFGEYMETKVYDAPGQNISNIYLGSNDLLIVYLGGAGGGEAGDYTYRVPLLIGTETGINWGPPGQSGGAAYAFLQPFPTKINENGEINMSNVPRYVQLKTTVGDGGRTGSNTAGTNKSGKGGAGGGGGSTVVEIVGEDSTLLKITAYGGAGGYNSYISTPASISPENFEGLIEYRSALGGIINGITIGGISSSQHGKVICQILRLN